MVRFYFSLFIILYTFSCSGNNSSIGVEQLVNEAADREEILVYADTGNVFALQKPIYFIGYYEKSPIFKEKVSNNLFVLNGSFSLFRKGNTEMEPMFINDRIIAYKKMNTDATSLVIETSDSKKVSFPIIFNTNHITASGDGRFVFYVEDGENDLSKLMMIDVVNGEESRFVTEVAYYVEAFDGNAYYLKISDNGFPSVDVYLSPLENFNSKKLLMRNVNINSITILPQVNLIYAYTWGQDKKVSMVYDVENKRYAEIYPNYSKENYFAFYSYERNAIGFYHPKNHDVKYIKLPEHYNNVREDDM